MKCADCVQLAKIKSGARMYYKCLWLNKYVKLEDTSTCLKDCPLEGKEKCRK